MLGIALAVLDWLGLHAYASHLMPLSILDDGFACFTGHDAHFMAAWHRHLLGDGIAFLTMPHTAQSSKFLAHLHV